jgi:pimeloyl-ACP methyl ester carboxylesterase
VAATVIAMPRLGMTMEEGTVVEWPLAIGAPVSKGQTVLVIETEKAEAEIEATVSGFFRHIYVEAGETVACGTLCGAISDTADEAFAADAFADAHASAEAVRPKTPAVATGPTASQQRTAPPRSGDGQSDRRPAAPAARALARKLELDLDAIPGSGPGGRITKQDVEAYATARENLISVAPGVALEVLREGEGDPVVLLPGFGADASTFAPQSAELAANYSLIAINPRGVGLSDAPDQERYEVSQAAHDAAALLDQPSHVVGASLGAAVALELALQHPDKVRSLTLITPFVEASPRLLSVTEAWCRIAERNEPKTLAAFLAPWFFGDGLLADDDARRRTLQGLAAMSARTPAAGLRRWAAGIEAWSGTRKQSLATIRIPTLCIVAGQDLLTPDSARVAAAIPNARTLEIPDAGHGVTIEGADAVTAALREHLNRS